MNQLATEFITFGLDELERETPRTILRRGHERIDLAPGPERN